MPATASCPNCGATLVRAFTVCPQCGARLPAAPDPTRIQPWGSPPAWSGGVVPPPAATSQMSYEERRAIDRTKTGVALLAVGSALGWIPIISILGGLLALVGAILVILGREAFGTAHSRNVVIAIVLYLIGLFGVLVLAVGFTGQLEAAVALPADQIQGAVVGAFNSFLIGGIIVGMFSGLAVVLFLYGLLDTTGKVLILASVFVSFAILALVWVLITGQVGAAVAAAFTTNPPDPGPLLALEAQMNSLHLINIIPDLLMAAAAYVAWTRIDRGRIPASAPLVR